MKSAKKKGSSRVETSVKALEVSNTLLGMGPHFLATSVIHPAIARKGKLCIQVLDNFISMPTFCNFEINFCSRSNNINIICCRDLIIYDTLAKQTFVFE